MRVGSRWSIVMCLASLAFLFLLVHTTGRGESGAPMPAPDRSSAARGSANAASLEAVREAAARLQAIIAADEQLAAVAHSAAQRQAAAVLVRQDVGQAGPNRERLVSARTRRYAPPAGPPDQARVPILMYHHIAIAPAGADAVRRDLSVSPAAFAQQMDYLRAQGYETIDLQHLVDHLTTGRPLPAKPIILTFDDGYDDNFTQAYPVLRSHRLTGVFFVLSDAMGNPGYMSWQEAAEMSRNGMDIQAHGRTHADLAISSSADVAWQVAGSKAMIEERIGRPVRFYCYPSGRYNARTIEILRQNGFTAAVTIDYGATHKAASLFDLPRLRIRGADTLEQFAAKLATVP